jgi:hypothetical protein
MVDASRRREVPCSRWGRSTDRGTPFDRGVILKQNSQRFF